MIWVTRARAIAFPAGDGGLVTGLAGLKEGLPIQSLAKELDHAGRPDSQGGFGLPRRGGTALTKRSAATRRVRVPTLAVLEGRNPPGPRAISTVCSR
jgi:hypothetical protein